MSGCIEGIQSYDLNLAQPQLDCLLINRCYNRGMEPIKPLDQIIRLSGKTAIVTGGARGIGFGIASRLAEAGANVVVADLNLAQASQATSTLSQKGWNSKAIAVNVANEEDVIKMVNETVSIFGSIDILVNNAGIFPSVPIANMTAADFDKVISVNLRGVFLCTKYASAQMIKQGKGGRIINITSIDALHPSTVGLAHYDASKHGVWGFTKNVALELAPHKIWVNAIAPGEIDTSILSPGTDKIVHEQIPMNRLGTPDEVAKIIYVLCTETSSYVNGAEIHINGGQHV